MKLVVVVSTVRNRTRRVILPVLTTTTTAPTAVSALTATRRKATLQDSHCSVPLCYYPVMALVIPTYIARSLREG